jgi:hypothetical protein
MRCRVSGMPMAARRRELPTQGRRVQAVSAMCKTALLACLFFLPLSAIEPSTGAQAWTLKFPNSRPIAPGKFKSLNPHPIPPGKPRRRGAMKKRH